MAAIIEAFDEYEGGLIGDIEGRVLARINTLVASNIFNLTNSLLDPIALGNHNIGNRAVLEALS